MLPGCQDRSRGKELAGLGGRSEPFLEKRMFLLSSRKRSPKLPRKEAKKLTAETRADNQRIIVMSLEMPDIMRILAE